MSERFDKWWTSQCLKMATGQKMYFARSVFPGDQKVAFDAGSDIWRQAHDAIYDENKDTKKYLVDAEWQRDKYKNALEQLRVLFEGAFIYGERISDGHRELFDNIAKEALEI